MNRSDSIELNNKIEHIRSKSYAFLFGKTLSESYYDNITSTPFYGMIFSFISLLI